MPTLVLPDNGLDARPVESFQEVLVCFLLGGLGWGV